MECHIVLPAQPVACCTPLFALCNTARVVQLDTEINTEDKDRQVEPHSHTITPRYLFIEICAEDSSGLRLILADRPYITGVKESRQLQKTDYLEPVFDIHIQFDIPHLEIVHHRVSSSAECTGSQRACLPSAYTVSSSSEIAFLERQDRSIQIGDCHAYAYMSHQMMRRRDNTMISEVHIPFGVLGKRYFPKHMLACFVLRQRSGFRQSVQDVACRLCTYSELQIRAVGETLVISSIGACIAPVKNKMVFVTGFQDRGFFYKLRAEPVRHPRYVDVVDVYEVELVRPPAPGSARDGIAETRVSNRARVLFRPLLVVVRYIHLHVRRKQQPCFRFRFDSPSSVGAPLIRSASADSQNFCSMEDIFIRIVYSGGYAPVACAIRSFHLHGERVQPAAGDSHIAIQQTVSYRVESDIHIFDRSQGIHSRIGSLHPPLGVPVAASQAAGASQGVLSQETTTGPTVLVAISVAVTFQHHRVRQMARVVVYLIVYLAERVLRPEAF